MFNKQINIGGNLLNLKDIPFGDEGSIKLPKIDCLDLKFEIDFLGFSKGSLFMYRGPHNLHVLEYNNYYDVHRDHHDPWINPIGHIEKDAPVMKIVIAGIVLIIVIIAAILLLRRK